MKTTVFNLKSSEYRLDLDLEDLIEAARAKLQAKGQMLPPGTPKVEQLPGVDLQFTIRLTWVDAAKAESGTFPTVPTDIDDRF